MKGQKPMEPAALPRMTAQTGRRPWKKRTPVEVVLDQINRLYEGIAEKEEELKQVKRQLQKLEDVKKVLEAT